MSILITSYGHISYHFISIFPNIFHNFNKNNKKKKTELVYVPPGYTSRVQPLDVSFNKPFKGVVRQQFEKHLEENLQRYTEGEITASERRILITKWIGNAWAEVSSNRDMVVRSFRKCGISLLLDGSENGDVHIESMEDYQFPTANEIIEFQLESESENEDDGKDDYEIDHDCNDEAENSSDNESSDDSNV